MSVAAAALLAFAMPVQAAQPTAAEAAAFVDKAEKELEALGLESAAASWVQANFITVDTIKLSALNGKRVTTAAVQFATDAKKFDQVQVDPVVRRKLELLKRGTTLPSPKDQAKATELAQIKSELPAMYGAAKWCEGDKCIDGNALEDLMRRERDPQKLLAAWAGWHAQAKPMKAKYARMVELANEGARELGYSDVGALWRSKYDMPPDAFAAETDRLWGQVKPLYESLHCYARGKLNEKYGDAVVSKTGPIPAHVLGNMWAQAWGEIFDVVAPADADPGYDLNKLLKEQNYDPIKITKAGEGFYTSIGFAPLPKTFYERSLFVKPRDREVVCHASAWDLDNKDDLRIKMCMSGTDEDFQVVHHELGHNIYQRAYKNQSPLFRGGANDGFHEAIGDTIQLALTPSYLKQIGLLTAEPDPSKDIGLLLKRAMDKVAFMPFGLLIDRWRWDVFAGKTKPADYEKAWWALREKYQGVKRPLADDADAFDPGAKFHVPGNTPYTRYFLAHVLEFQFHKAACEQAGWTGPLHRCTFYGNKEVGKRYNAMLEMGASKPWPEALKAFTGTDKMDASAMLAYFAPLKTWLDEQNKGRQCGWN
ncbi:M2 family metallopeptidase [Roseiterribacter gracilis]|uniref:Peptidase M2 n=1 Tax=Roseiterribacter gracilis TaxID=2812848 RepID=A0A8S8XFN5_9PROT|nr:peptidase M2 [Rhodospirillales bacterium TMPK1]